MFTRKIGKLLRGDSTPFQLYTAAILASLIGFIPGFMQGPGLFLTFLALLVVLNANLALAALIGGLAKLVSLLIMPITFKVGYFLLDGPTSGLFQSMINAPVLALFGFEHYATTGGLVMGLVFGIVSGVTVSKIILAFRKKIAELEQNSEKFAAYKNKWWVKVLFFLFVGGKHGKKTYAELLDRKIGNPIRPLGAVLVVLSAVLGVVVYLFASEPIVTMLAQKSLERANGATVDLESADLNLKENRFTLTGLAMADPNALDTDLLRTASVEADLSGVSLLTKRLQIDRMVLNDATHGETRSRRGELIGPPPEPTPEPADLPDAKTIEDYITKAKEWKERLAQAKEWLDKMSGPDEEPAGPGEETETLRERLEREIREKGYAFVKASHLIEGAPTLTISELIAEKVRVAQLEGETLNITGKNLSTHPRLLGKTPEFKVESDSDKLLFDTVLGSLGAGDGKNTLVFHFNGLETDKVASEIKFDGQNPIQGGTMDISFDGTWNNQSGVYVDLPLQVTLHDVTISLPSVDSTQVDELTLPIQVIGPLDNPAIQVEGKALSDVLVQAGISRATDEVTDLIKDELGDEVGGAVGEQGRNLLNRFRGNSEEEQE